MHTAWANGVPICLNVLQVSVHREGKERVSSEETWALVFIPTMCLILGDKTGASGAKIALGAHDHLVRDFVMGPR